MARTRTAQARIVDAALGRDRKAEHIELAADERMQLAGSCFDAYAFEHQALPEVDFERIDTSATFLGRRLTTPC